MARSRLIARHKIQNKENKENWQKRGFFVLYPISSTVIVKKVLIPEFSIENSSVSGCLRVIYIIFNFSSNGVTIKETDLERSYQNRYKADLH